MDISKTRIKMTPKKVKLGKMLAQSIKKANTPSNCYHNQKYWIDVSYELVSQSNIVTEFVPVREWIKCIQNGNLKIAIKLSPDVKTNNEIRARANSLIRELSIIYADNSNIYAYIEEADHLLKVLDALNLVFFHYKQGKQKVVKEYLNDQIKKNTELNIKYHKEAKYLANSIPMMLSEDHMEYIFDSLKTIIPIRQHYSKSPNRSLSFYDGKALALKFPLDAVLNYRGKVVVWKTLGLGEGSFSNFLEFKAMLYENDDQQQHEILLNKVLLFKSKGYDLQQVIEKTIKRYPQASLKDITTIYNQDTEQDISTDYVASKMGEDFIKVMGEDV